MSRDTDAHRKVRKSTREEIRELIDLIKSRLPK